MAWSCLVLLKLQTQSLEQTPPQKDALYFYKSGQTGHFDCKEQDVRRDEIEDSCYRNSSITVSCLLRSSALCHS